jgi:hypothetical protein
MFYNKSKNTLQFGIIPTIEASVLETESFFQISSIFDNFQYFSESLPIPESN